MKPYDSIPHWESLLSRCFILRRISHICLITIQPPILYSSLVLLGPVWVPVELCDFSWDGTNKWLVIPAWVPTDQKNSSPHFHLSEPVILSEFCTVLRWKVTYIVVDSKAAASWRILVQEGKQLKSLETLVQLSDSMTTWDVPSPAVACCFSNFRDGVCDSWFIYILSIILLHQGGNALARMK